MIQRPKSGEIYRHFKDKLYQIVTIATHSETGEELVIYQALYGTYKCYARPLTMFMSEVDHEKYPNVTQRYRFEKIDIENKEDKNKDRNSKIDNIHKQHIQVEEQQKIEASVFESKTSEKKTESNKYDRVAYQAHCERYEIKQSSKVESVPLESLTIEEKMMAFFDADDLEERYKILLTMSKEITDTMIDNMAVVMDVVIEDGDITKRYDDLKYAIQTKQRYEQTIRLR